MNERDKKRIDAIDRINSAGVRISLVYREQLKEAMFTGDLEKAEYIIHKLDNMNKMRVSRLYDKKQIIIDNECRKIDNEIDKVSKQICMNLLKK